MLISNKILCNHEESYIEQEVMARLEATEERCRQLSAELDAARASAGAGPDAEEAGARVAELEQENQVTWLCYLTHFCTDILTGPRPSLLSCRSCLDYFDRRHCSSAFATPLCCVFRPKALGAA